MINSELLKRFRGFAHGFGTIQDPRPANAVTVKQVHGVAVWEPTEVSASEPEGYDIVLVDRPGIAAAVKTADCQPILAIDPEAGIAAAIHAGWKGALARAAQAGIRRLVERGARPERLVCALGPNMVGRCFEVEADVAGDFEREFPGWPILQKISDSKWLLDVALANRLQLREMGIPDDRIDLIDLCTHCRPDLFWSFRRDGEKAGRMVNFVEILV